MSYRDKQVLQSFAKLAAEGYLGKTQTPLNDSLKKIASQESLTPHQIEFVAGEANKEVWAKLFALDKKSSYDFPLADAKAVLKEVQLVDKKPVVSQTDMDYLSAPESTKLASWDVMKAMGFEASGIDKVAARKELKRTLQNRYEKLAMAKEEIERLMFVKQSHIEKGELEFVKSARDMLLEEILDDRGQAMEKVAEFLRGCDHPDYGRRLMAKLASVMRRQGLIKTADLKAPEEYISETLPARIINGRHALYVTIKTLFQNYDEYKDLSSRYEIVDSSLPVVKEKIREL